MKKYLPYRYNQPTTAMNVRSTYALPSLLLPALLLGACEKKSTVPPPATPYNGPRDTLTTGWSAYNTGLPGSIYDIYFTDNQRGYACGTAGIYRSTNGGTSWVDYASPYNPGNIAAFGSSAAVFTGTDNKIIKTIDGSSFFSYIYNTRDVFTNFHDVYMPAAGTCYATSARYFWKINPSSQAADTLYNFGSFANTRTTLHFIDASNGWVNREGRLYRTADGGTSWTAGFSASGNAGGIEFLNAQTGYFAAGRTVYKTVDGGATATPVLTAYTGTTGYMDVDFLDSANGYVSDGRRVYKTTDGGARWNVVLVFLNLTINEIHFSAANRGWAACNYGYVARFVQ
ncbi:WD40/YVTN/BNR-like repeat-containing protein [Flaviaesturariibacter aridisoli]|uniref:Photosynthesis system II assembly factor Ycf48/Hcf136-like domain-containing protein n=1 Tax=Flaviaesturariibacter aridisoli TaxID=2545761 RepID=A0A4R4E381_9BACT|nr:hypothetical protein [Flaviaesturariibacter aridisoli]TCZ70460.1 hypothetical protein E0486_10920 [Flaviaesturariibacter aridisoli]